MFCLHQFGIQCVVVLSDQFVLFFRLDLFIFLNFTFDRFTVSMWLLCCDSSEAPLTEPFRSEIPH